jgi:hypothetical protein
MLIWVGEKVEQKIESTRSILNEMVSESNAVLSEGEILEISVQLDKIIAEYYGESSI